MRSQTCGTSNVTTEPAKRAAKKIARPASGLAAAIKKAPRLSAPKEAHARLGEWLGEIERAPSAKALKERLAAPKLVELVASIAEASPYLRDLIRADPARFSAVLASEPEERFASVLADARSAGEAESEADAMRMLRRAKAEAALLIALADIGGVWTGERVTSALTEFADAALGGAVRYLLRGASDKLKARNPAKPEEGSGYVVLLMGKGGAFELNYSSDIDLIVLYDADAAPLEGAEPGSFFARLTRGLVKLMQERTVDGYVFRTDLRLRPDPASTPIAISLVSALNYYESTGQNWERAAMIKARPCAGDLALGETFLREVAPFVWRKYLDYGAVADVHAMKRQMAAYKGHDEIAIEGHNIKLGRGGIREIEFFVQTQQLIAGGRNPTLRGRETMAMLAALAEGGWIDSQPRDDLSAAYCFLRGVEHRLQMVNDEQTHTLPSDRDSLEQFARFLCFPDRDSFAKALLAHLHRVQEHYASLFEQAASAEA